jgi:O-antigen ligase
MDRRRGFGRLSDVSLGRLARERGRRASVPAPRRASAVALTVRAFGLPLDWERRLLPQLREARPAEFAVAAAASVLGGCLLAGTGDWIAFGVIGIAFFAAIGALRPALFLALFILVRPLLDDISDLDAGARSANVGGALALALILAAALVAARQRRMIWPVAVPALLLAIAVSAVSALQAWQDFGAAVGTEAAGEVVRVAALLAAYVLGANVFATPEQSRRLFVVVALCGVLPGILGIVEWVKGPPLAENLDIARISGPFVGPVPYGAFLAVTALVLLFVPGLRPSIRVPAVLLVCIPLVGSSSREGWVVFTAGVVLLAWRGRKRMLVTIAIVVVALIAAVPTVRERALPSQTQSGSAAVQQSYESWHWRTENWRGLLDKWREQPLFGYGLTSTTSVNPRAPAATAGQPRGGFDAHSLLVRLLVEGGVVLLAVYVAFFVVLMRGLRTLARGTWELHRLGRLLLVIWTLLLVVGVTTDDPFDETAVMIPLLALTGSLEAARRTYNARTSPSAQADAAR